MTLVKPNDGFWPDTKILQWFKSPEAKKEKLIYIKAGKRMKTNKELMVVNNQLVR